MSGPDMAPLRDEEGDAPASWQSIDEMVPVRADADRPSAALARALAKGRAEQAQLEEALERLRAELSSLTRLVDGSDGVADEVTQLEQSVVRLHGASRRPAPLLSHSDADAPGSGGLGDNHALTDALNRLGTLSRAERVLTAYTKVTDRSARAQRALDAEGEVRDSTHGLCPHCLHL